LRQTGIASALEELPLAKIRHIEGFEDLGRVSGPDSARAMNPNRELKRMDIKFLRQEAQREQAPRNRAEVLKGARIRP
jgi:hypothetical protein